MSTRESNALIENLFGFDRSASTCEEIKTIRPSFTDEEKLGAPKVVACASLTLPEK